MTKPDPRQVIINLAIQKKKALILKINSHNASVREQRLALEEQNRVAEEQRKKLIEEQNRVAEEQRKKLIEEQNRVAAEQRKKLIEEQNRVAAEQRKKLIEEQLLLKEKVNNDKFDLAKDLSGMIDFLF
jgi:hypothetical protein